MSDQFQRPYKAVRGENLSYVEGSGHHRSDFEDAEYGDEEKSMHFAKTEAGILNRAYNEGMKSRKPPLGVIPKHLWKEQRAKDLSRAINQYIDGGFIGDGFYQQVSEWIVELSDLWQGLKP
jgi:hypothetical protein